MLAEIISSIIVVLLIFFVIIMYYGIKFIRTRHYALVPNQQNTIDDVYIQFV
jgi:hypothetical protein